jgi:hypothetical protein
MVSESDFIAAFQAYHDALQDPAAKIDTIRPLVNQHLDELIARLPGVTVQNAARQRAMIELDRIEEMTKDKAVEIAEDIEEFEEEVIAKTQALTPAAIFIEPENPAEGSPFTVGFSGNSEDPTAWIGIFSAGAPHGEHGSNWLYVNGTSQPVEGKTAGSVTFSGEQYVAGDYDARLFRNNGHELMASATFTISPQFEVTEPEPEPKDSLREAFNVFDRDGNGTIDLGELAHMMSALGENLSPEEVAKLLTDYDTDGDGVINFEEFKVIMLTPRNPSEEPVEEEPEIETTEVEMEEMSQPEVSTLSSGLSIADVESHLESLKLFGDKRRYIESLSDEVFDFTLKIEKMEKTIGIRLTDSFRGGNTCIGMIDDLGVGVRMPNTMELTLGQEVYVEAKLLEYRSVVKRFEFEHL